MVLTLYYLLITLPLLCNFLLLLLLLLLVPRFTTRSPLHSLSRAVAWRESRTRSAATLLMLWETGSGCPLHICPLGVAPGSCPRAGRAHSSSRRRLGRLLTVWNCPRAGECTLFSTSPSSRQWWAALRANSQCRWRIVLRRNMRWRVSWLCAMLGGARSTYATGKAMGRGRTPGSQRATWETPRSY